MYSPRWNYHLISRRWRIPMFYLNFSKVEVGNALVNIFSRLSLEWACWTFISPFFWKSWVKKKFGEICFVLSPLMYPSLSWAIHPTLSSYNVVGASPFKERPHVYWMCWVSDLNHPYSWLASWITIISAWLKKWQPLFVLFNAKI